MAPIATATMNTIYILPKTARLLLLISAIICFGENHLFADAHLGLGTGTMGAPACDLQ